MDTIFIFTVLVILEGRLCFYTTTVDGKEKVDRRDSIFLNNKELQRIAHDRVNVEIDNLNVARDRTPSFEFASSHTTILANSQHSNDNITLTITTIPTVEIWWTFTELTTMESVITLGKFRYDGHNISSSIVYSENMVSLGANMAAKDFKTTFLIDSDALLTGRNDSFSGFVGSIEAPLNVSLNDNTLEFRYKQTTSNNPASDPRFSISYISFGGDSTSHSPTALRNEIVETDTQGTFHVTCDITGIDGDGQIWIDYISENQIDRVGSIVNSPLVQKMIPVQRKNHSSNRDYLFLPMKRDFGSIKSYVETDFRYGSLICYAFGRPTPIVDFYKHDYRMYSITISYFGSVSVGFLPFDGLSLHEISGKYVCNGISGTKSITSEYVVENA